jgi:hypothetical protein
VSTDEIRKLEAECRTAGEEIGRLYDRQRELEEEIRRLRVAEFNRNTREHLSLIEWEPIGAYTSGAFAGRIFLDGCDIPDELDDAIHDAIRLGYHDEAELREGVLLRVDDEKMRLIIDGTEALLDAASRFRLNIRWERFREILAEMEGEAFKSEEQCVRMRSMVKRLGLIEDEG